MTPGEWTAIAGLATGIAGAIWGYAMAWGRTKGKIDGHEEAIKESRELMDKLVQDFGECQKRGTECTASTRIPHDATARKLIELKNDLLSYKVSVHNHHENQVVHTSQEWRVELLRRLDKMESSYDRKVELLSDNLMARMASLEQIVRSGRGD